MGALRRHLVEDTEMLGVEFPVIQYLRQCQGTSLIIQMSSFQVSDPQNDKLIKLAV